MRAFSFTATFVPVFLAAVFARYEHVLVNWDLFPAALAGGLCVNAAADLINDYHDFKKGVDKEDSLGSSRVIFEGSLNPEQILRASLFFFFLAAVIGAFFVCLRGALMLAIAAFGIIGAYFYTGSRFAYKYYAMGEPFVFLLMGPLMAAGAYLAVTGKLDFGILLASLPAGFLVAAILNGNNLRDMEYDGMAGIRTIAIVLGEKGERALYASLIGLSYVSVAAMAYFKIIPIHSLLVFLTLPIAYRLIADAYKGRARQLASIDIRTAILHLSFGVLYLISFVL